MEIKRGFIASLLFFFLQITYCFQCFFKKSFWLLTVEPALLLSKALNKRDSLNQRGTQGGVPFVTLDFLKFSHRCLWKYLKFMGSLYTNIAGTPNRFDYYEKILRWNNEIPIIGFAENKTKYTFRLLGQYSSDSRTRGFDFAWLSTFKKIGCFQIAEKKLSNEPKKPVVLICVWITGEYIGKSFEIKDFTSPEDLENKLIPGEIYCPPKIVIFLFEALISVGFILSLIQFSKGGLAIFNSIVDFVVRTWRK